MPVAEPLSPVNRGLAERLTTDFGFPAACACSRNCCEKEPTVKTRTTDVTKTLAERFNSFCMAVSPFQAQDLHIPVTDVTSVSSSS